MTDPISEVLRHITSPLRRPLPDTPEWHAEQPGELLTPVDVASAAQTAKVAGITKFNELQDGSVKLFRTDGATLTLSFVTGDQFVTGEAVGEATLATTTATGTANEPEISTNDFHDGDDTGEDFLRYVVGQIIDWASDV